jgi:peptidyl-prolyl cis-trans isomerase SurA
MIHRLLTPAITLLALTHVAFSEPVEVNGIAAKVNGKVITKNQVSFLLSPIFSQLSTQFPRRGPEFVKQFEEAQQNVLKELIDRQIIVDEFNKLGATINASVIDEEVKRQIHQLYSGDEKKFRDELKKSRLTMEAYREMTREKMVVQAMRAQQFSDAPPPLPNEIQNEYNKIKESIRDVTQDKITFLKIFIPSTDPANATVTPESQLALAEELADKISNGTDFEEIAKTHSKDAFASTGGLQENVPRTDLAAEFAAIIFDTPVDKVTGPLLDPRGFTIVKVIKKELGPAPSLSQVRPMIEERVTRNKTSAQYERWIESRRKRAMIETKL